MEDYKKQFLESGVLDGIKTKVDQQNELEIVKTTSLTNKDGSVVFCEVRKRLYIADKAYFKKKRANKQK